MTSIQSDTTKKSKEIRHTKIYTKTGDAGKTSLYNSERQFKDTIHFDALGNCDELNANLGLAHYYCGIAKNGLEVRLGEIQHQLFEIGTFIATPLTSSSTTRLKTIGEFNGDYIEQLELWIDDLEKSLPPLKNFILPSGGGLASCQLHIARTICRRAERTVVTLFQDGDVDAVIVRYLNRLSDLLFVAARYAAWKEGKQEQIWIKKQ